MRRLLSDGGWAVLLAGFFLALGLYLVYGPSSEAQTNYTGSGGPGGGPFNGPYYPVMPFVYTKVNVTSGNTYTFTCGQELMVITNSSGISALTIGLTATPYDGMKNCFYTQSAITTLTLQATAPPTGVTATLNNAVTSTSATTGYCYLYSASNNTWDRT